MSMMRNENFIKKTYADLEVYPENERWEIINGFPLMQAAPSWQHQFVSSEIQGRFYQFLQGKPCRIVSSPFDVMLALNDEPSDEITNVVQPDLVIVCDSSRLTGTGYKGAPRLIIEIISPGTARQDRFAKYNLYQKAGVASYWIVQPDEHTIAQYHLSEKGVYDLVNVAADSDIVTDIEFPGLEIVVKDLFPQDLNMTEHS